MLLTTLRLLVGTLLLGVGIYGTWDQHERKYATEKGMAALEVISADGLPRAPTDVMDDSYDDQFVLF